MELVGKYGIHFKGLAPGRHTYRFEVDDDFFRTFEWSEIVGGTATVDVVLTKESTGVLSAEVEIEGTVTLPCDRCLDDFSLPVQYSGRFTVKFGPVEEEFDGETMWLSPTDNEINMAQYIYESIVLALPLKRVHPENKCNRQMMEFLNDASQEEEPAAGKMETIEDKLRGAQPPAG